jgi:hypothetical protein
MFAYHRGMTSQGSPYTRFRRAVNTGNLAIVEGALLDLPHIGIDDALEVVVLMAKAGDPRFQRAADRWAAMASDKERDGLRELVLRLPDDSTAERLRTRVRELR